MNEKLSVFHTGHAIFLNVESAEVSVGNKSCTHIRLSCIFTAYINFSKIGYSLFWLFVGNLKKAHVQICFAVTNQFLLNLMIFQLALQLESYSPLIQGSCSGDKKHIYTQLLSYVTNKNKMVIPK